MPECFECRFYRDNSTREGQCRRRAPTPYNFLKYYELELLRELVVALSIVARIPPKDMSYDAKTEATEAFESACWPNVEPDDWCGEFEPAKNDGWN